MLWKMPLYKVHDDWYLYFRKPLDGNLLRNDPYKHESSFLFFGCMDNEDPPDMGVAWTHRMVSFSMSE